MRGQDRSMYKYCDNTRHNIVVKFCIHTKSKKQLKSKIYTY